MDRTEIRFLNLNERKILKVIRLNKHIGARHYGAELIYARDVSLDYITQYKRVNTVDGNLYEVNTVFPQDTFDSMVLKAVRTQYPEANFSNLDVNTDSCIERLKTIYERKHREEALIYFIPELSQIDPLIVSRGTKYSQFRIRLGVYTTSKESLRFFSNEGFFDYYDLADTEKIASMLKETLPTVHPLEELFK